MELTAEIISLRPYLFQIAYNMLGVVADAEDIVHDTYEKWVSVEGVKQPKAYLGRIAVNRSIDRLRELKKQQESYIGYWLPEPYITDDDDESPTIEYGLLFLLESLNPIERAVFILRESFSEEYHYIAELIDTSVENCRQLLHRAHKKLSRKRFQPIDPSKYRLLIDAFFYSLQAEDRTKLEALLRADVELYSDGGGKRNAARKPLCGQEKVLKFLLGVMQLPENQKNEFVYRSAFVNGAPAVLLFRHSTGELDSMLCIEVDQTEITRLLYVRNPDKLRIRQSSVAF